MAALKALLFDVDGTLADTERDGHRVAFNAAFQGAGLPWRWDEALYGELLAVAGGKERIHYFIAHYSGAADLHGADLDAAVKALHRHKTDHYLALLKRGGVALRPGVARLVRSAREAGLRLAIATTTTTANVIELLENCLAPGASSWFEVIAAGDDVSAKKPDPAIYRYALERLALPPTTCIALEDSDNGLKAALGAGLTTLVTVTDYTRQQDFSGAALVVDQLGEPQMPCTVLQGESYGHAYVDLALLQRLVSGSP